jgi:hypothetical protein
VATETNSFAAGIRVEAAIVSQKMLAAPKRQTVLRKTCACMLTLWRAKRIAVRNTSVERSDAENAGVVRRSRVRRYDDGHAGGV